MPTLVLPNDLTLSYDDHGPREARPVVLIHGMCMSRRFFHRQLEQVTRARRVLALDLRGHGDSSKTEAGHTMPQYARDLQGFIGALGLERPVLVGWSMGAFVAW